MIHDDDDDDDDNYSISFILNLNFDVETAGQSIIVKSVYALTLFSVCVIRDLVGNPCITITRPVRKGHMSRLRATTNAQPLTT